MNGLVRAGKKIRDVLIDAAWKMLLARVRARMSADV